MFGPAFDALVDHIVPGRSKEARTPNEEEILRTLVLALPLDEASAKIRRGPPVDDEEDYALDVWAGEIPLKLVASSPITDPKSDRDVSDCVTSRFEALASNT